MPPSSLPADVSPELAPTVDLMGVALHNLTEDELVHHVVGRAAEGRGGWVATPNVDVLRLMVTDASVRELISKADLVVTDGMPLIWASRLQGTPLRQRLAGSEIIQPLCARAAQEGVGVFLLGGAPGTAERAAEVLAQRYPGLRISHLCPPIGFETDQTWVQAVHDALRAAAPGLVFCGFGTPKQERFIISLVPDYPATWFIGTGGTFSMVAGDKPKAPLWMRRCGLEWAHRLRLEPTRLFERYIVHDLPFALRLLAVSGARRFSRRRA